MNIAILGKNECKHTHWYQVQKELQMRKHQSTIQTLLCVQTGQQALTIEYEIWSSGGTIYIYIYIYQKKQHISISSLVWFASKCAQMYMNVNYKMRSDEDISGDHLLAEARVSLVKIFPQMQKQFQVLAMMVMAMMMMMMMILMVERRRVMMMTLVFTLFFQVCLHRPTHKVGAQLNSVSVSLSLSAFLSIPLSAFLSIPLSAYQSIHLSAYLSIPLSVSVSQLLSLYMNIEGWWGWVCSGQPVWKSEAQSWLLLTAWHAQGVYLIIISSRLNIMCQVTVVSCSSLAQSDQTRRTSDPFVRV